jgi:transposase
MTRRHGHYCRGWRLIGRVPRGHRKTTTFAAGLRVDAVTAPFVIAGRMTGAIFRTYIKRYLVPTLSCGDIVIIDNLSADKARLAQAGGRRGARGGRRHPSLSAAPGLRRARFTRSTLTRSKCSWPS